MPRAARSSSRLETAASSCGRSVVLELGEVVAVRVPGGVGVGRPGDAGDARAGLDQPAGEQDALAVDVPAVAVAGARVFAVDVGTRSRVAGEVSRSKARAWKPSRSRSALVALEARRGACQAGDERLPAVEAGRVDAVRGRQLGHAEVGGVGVLEDEERVVRPAQPAAEEARLRRAAGPFGRDVRHRHVGNDRRFGRPAEPDDRADRRVVGRLERRRRARRGRGRSGRSRRPPRASC